MSETSGTSGYGDGRDVAAETAAAGEGTWDQTTGRTPGNTPDGGPDDPDPADTAGHELNPSGELVSDGVQPDEKGHGDGELEERVDQRTGPSGVQREREDLVVYDPDANGRVGLGGEGDLDANPSDPASYPNPDEQRRGTSRDIPEGTD